MATIKSQMVLNDGMSAVLKKITGALDITLHSFEQVQRASGQAINAAQIAQARSQLVGANAQLDEMAENYRRAAQHGGNLNQSLRNGTAAAGGMLGKVKNIVATLAAGVGVKMFAGLSDQLASGRARVSLLVDDGGSVAELEQKIMASAQRSRAAYLDTLQTVGKLGLMAGDAFGSNDELIAFTELMNKNFVIAGASTQEQASAMYQLTQAMSSGRLQGDEYRSIIENAPLLANAIEDYMRNVQMAEGSMKDWASEGLLTADVIKAALFSSADEVEARFAQMPMTWGQIWTNMKNKALTIFDPILTRMNEIANSEQFDTTINGLITGLATVGAVATGLFDLMVGIGFGISENWSVIEPIVWGIAAALLAYHGIMLAVNAVQIISNGLAAVSAARSAIKAGASLAEAAATTTATGAQVGLNAALLACPITWIIFAIIALIAVFYAAIAAINHLAGTSLSATGMICGAFMAALAFIGNIFVGLWNLISEVIILIYNLVAEVANFIGNVFNDPIGSVCRLFFGLADTVLGVLQALASAVDALFGSNLSGAIQGWRDSLGGWVDGTFGQENEIMAKMTADDMKLNRFEYGAAYNMGYDFGKGIDDKVGGLFSTDLGAAGNYGGFALDGITANTGAIADNTGASADALTVSNEQLAYMRDIAERDAINRFTTAEVKIDMTGMTNRIDGSADLDGVISQLTSGFSEALLTAAEGVHA